MKIILKKIKLIIVSFFYIPHYLIWMIHPSNKIIDRDFATYESKELYPFKGFFLKAYLLQNDPYFRQLFYYRIGLISVFIRWYAPGERTFMIECAAIGEKAYFPHSYSTIINAKSIGKCFVCRQCTTIGNKKDGRNDLTPVIGDNVNVGANVVIIGNITIGNNVIIGAGSVVVHDVPDNCVVVGNPARVIKSLI